MRATIPLNGYIPPDEDDIRYFCNQENYKHKVSTELIQELCNFYVGGMASYVPTSTVDKEDVKYVSNVHRLLENLPSNTFKGSPLAKSVQTAVAINSLNNSILKKKQRRAVRMDREIAELQRRQQEYQDLSDSGDYSPEESDDFRSSKSDIKEYEEDIRDKKKKLDKEIEKLLKLLESEDNPMESEDDPEGLADAISQLASDCDLLEQAEKEKKEKSKKGEDGQEGEGEGEGEGDGEGEETEGTPMNSDERLHDKHPEDIMVSAEAMGVNIINSDFSPIKFSEVTTEEANILKKLSVVNSFNGSIAGEAKIKRKRKVSSKKRGKLKMESYKQVNQASFVERMMPGFDKKFIQKDVLIKDKYVSEVCKQTLVLLIDDSGSMNSEWKIGWVKALVLNRLTAVMKGDATLYICTFEEELDPNWVKVGTKAQAKDYWKLFDRQVGFNRGNTDIEKAVTHTIEQIDNGKLIGVDYDDTATISLKKERPQICVINDGQDYIDKDYSPKIITHGFILGRDNIEMKIMCERSGGIYHRIGHVDIY
jgi:hypothetical protein